MTRKKDYYDILGVAKTASDKEVKSAYRRLARKYHPDVNKGDKGAEAKFKEIAEAFAVLSDKDKRARYDSSGHSAFGAGFDPFAGYDPQHFEFGFGNLGDLLNMFGGMGGQTGRASSWPRRGEDLRLRLRLPFLDAAEGRTVELEMPTGGVKKRIKVRVPAGIEDGATMRLAGQGSSGVHGGKPGDVFLEVEVEPHPLFRRQGRDLLCDVPIGFATAALGGRVRIPTLQGEATIEVPAGTRSDQRLRLKGKGLRGPKDKAAGDLYAIIHIQPPKRLTDRSRELLEEFREIHPKA